MSIETRFDIPFVAALALRERQVQQVYRPLIAVHKVFARRPGSLFPALALAELAQAPLERLSSRPMTSPGSGSPTHSWEVGHR